MRTCSSRAAVAAAVLALVAAGCGGSPKKSTSAKSVTTTTTASKPLSKAAYESRLGPLLNDRVGPALKAALANGGARNPRELAKAARLLNEAHDAMGSLSPPAKIADLNRRADTMLGALAHDMTKMKDSLQAHSRAGYLKAARTTARDALKIQSIGSQFTARGY